MAKTWMVRDLPTPKQLAPAAGSGSTYLAPAGAEGATKAPRAAKPKAAPKAAKSNTTGALVDKTRTLEKSSAMY